MAREPDRSRSDSELMACLAQGQIEALGELYFRHGAKVSSLLTRLLPGFPPADVEDLCQEVFIAVHDSAGRYRETGKFGSWLYGIVWRKVQNRRRRTWLRRRLLDRHSRTQVDASATRQGARPASTEVHMDLMRALPRLPQGQRDVLLLHAVEGFSGQEIADTLGIDSNTVWTRLHRARRAMRLALDQAEQGAAREAREK